MALACVRGSVFMMRCRIIRYFICCVFFLVNFDVSEIDENERISVFKCDGLV